MATKDHIKPLTSIRALGVFWVIIGHYHMLVYTIQNDTFREVIRYTILAVDTFFFLSGFVLAYIYSEKFTALKESKKHALSFFFHRFGRIYPLHLITLLSMLALSIGGILTVGSPLIEAKMLHNNTVSTFFYNLFLVHGTGIVKQTSWNYPSWSVSVEFCIYLLFPLLIPMLHRLRFWLFNVLIIAAVCVYYYTTISDFSLQFDSYSAELKEQYKSMLFIPYTWQNDLVRGLANFIIGLCLYNLYAQNFLKKLPWDWILCTICITMLAMMLTRTPMNVVILIMPLFIYALAQLRGFMQWIFCNKVLVYLGEISYGLYMWHIPYAIFVLYMVYDNQIGVEFWQWQFIPFIGGLIALSSFSYHYFETPCRQWIKKREKNKNS